jgi:molecular chaperone DnaK
MGFRLGLDFGTTTSILTYEEDSRLKAFDYGDKSIGGGEYVPSVVSYQRSNVIIGQPALQLAPADARQYRYFKMLLPEEQKENWPLDYGPYLADGLAPCDVTADFIGELINGTSSGREMVSRGSVNRYSFRQRHQANIDRIVVSVPQVWPDWRARGRRLLQDVVNKLGLKLFQLISEPVAAAAYFAHRYQELHTVAYEGTLLVCDMGGGTFDVALCRLAEKRVEVLCNDGDGARGLGRAGVHFDYQLIEAGLRKEHFQLPLESGLMADLLDELDQLKKLGRQTPRLRRAIMGEEQTGRIFGIDSKWSAKPLGLSFGFDEIKEAFRPVNEGMTEVLNRIKSESERLGETIDKVVLVGGFSKFPLVQQAVAEFLGETIDNLTRLDLDTIDPEDMAFAISYGACLIANERIEISEKYDHTIALEVYNSSGPEEVEEIELIKTGRPLDALKSPVFCLRPDGCPRRMKLTRTPVEVSISVRRLGSEEQKITRTVVLDELPSADVPDNRWYVGAFVDASKIPYLVVEDEKLHKVREYSIGDLLPIGYRQP